MKKKKVKINHASDFDGVYATVLGRVTIKKESPDAYTAYTDNGTFKLYKTKNNLYKLKYKLLGLIPIANDELDEIELYTDDIEGHHAIIAFWHGNKFIAGVKVHKPKLIPDAWKKYVGHYKVLNNFEIKESQIKDVFFKIENGYALIKLTGADGNKAASILKPVNDTEAIIEGLGRSMQETVYLKDGIFHAQGLRFEKVD